MSTEYWIDETVLIIDNEDGTWSVVDNGDEIDGLSYTSAMSLALEFTMSDEDIEAWHAGEGMTPHLEEVWGRFPKRLVFQVWGSREGSEPLNVVVTDEEA
jgi:hypothetical protein